MVKLSLNTKPWQVPGYIQVAAPGRNAHEAGGFLTGQTESLAAVFTRGAKITSGMDPRLNQSGPTLIVLAEHKRTRKFNTEIQTEMIMTYLPLLALWVFVPTVFYLLAVLRVRRLRRHRVCIKDVDPLVLSDMCDEFRRSVFDKAKKADPKLISCGGTTPRTPRAR